EIESVGRGRYQLARKGPASAPPETEAVGPSRFYARVCCTRSKQPEGKEAWEILAPVAIAGECENFHTMASRVCDFACVQLRTRYIALKLAEDPRPVRSQDGKEADEGIMVILVEVTPKPGAGPLLVNGFPEVPPTPLPQAQAAA